MNLYQSAFPCPRHRVKATPHAECRLLKLFGLSLKVINIPPSTSTHGFTKPPPHRSSNFVPPSFQNSQLLRCMNRAAQPHTHDPIQEKHQDRAVSDVLRDPKVTSVFSSSSALNLRMGDVIRSTNLSPRSFLPSVTSSSDSGLGS